MPVVNYWLSVPNLLFCGPCRLFFCQLTDTKLCQLRVLERHYNAKAGERDSPFLPVFDFTYRARALAPRGSGCIPHSVSYTESPSEFPQHQSNGPNGSAVMCSLLQDALPRQHSSHSSIVWPGLFFSKHGPTVQLWQAFPSPSDHSHCSTEVCSHSKFFHHDRLGVLTAATPSLN